MMTENESPLLYITDTVSWRDRWQLLDVETSGLDRQEDDIIALRLTCMENYNVIQERKILIRPPPPAPSLGGMNDRHLQSGLGLGVLS